MFPTRKRIVQLHLSGKVLRTTADQLRFLREQARKLKERGTLWTEA